MCEGNRPSDIRSEIVSGDEVVGAAGGHGDFPGQDVSFAVARSAHKVVAPLKLNPYKFRADRLRAGSIQAEKVPDDHIVGRSAHRHVGADQVALLRSFSSDLIERLKESDQRAVAEGQGPAGVEADVMPNNLVVKRSVVGERDARLLMVAHDDVAHDAVAPGASLQGDAPVAPVR